MNVPRCSLYCFRVSRESSVHFQGTRFSLTCLRLHTMSSRPQQDCSRAVCQGTGKAGYHVAACRSTAQRFVVRVQDGRRRDQTLFLARKAAITSPSIAIEVGFLSGLQKSKEMMWHACLLLNPNRALGVGLVSRIQGVRTSVPKGAG